MGIVLRVRRDPTGEDAAGDALLAVGLRVVEIAGAAEAMERLAAGDVDLVVADVPPAGGAAAAFCRAVRAHPDGDDVPIVLLAAAPPAEEEHAALLEAGASALLVEPVPPRVLCASARALVDDVTARRTAADDLERDLERLRLAQQAGRIGVFDWDLRTGRISFSDEQERIYGLVPGVFPGTFDAWTARVLPDDAALLRSSVDAALAARDAGLDLAFRIRRDDGELRYVEGAARFVYDRAGQPLRAVGVNLDVTERRRVAADRETRLRAAEQARDVAEGANRAKDAFLAMLGHELRNPLAAVHGAVLTARLDPGHATRALDIAKRQAEQLSRIVDDVLDVARLTQGRLALGRERADLRRIADRAVDTCRPLIDSRHHALAVTAPGEPVAVEVDPERLEQAVANLVGNAAKFTEPGGRIEITVAHEGDEAVLRVRDTGVGISSELLPRVFDLFAQGERGPDRLHGGLGIGLTVARRLVELHGGTITARSPGPGLGAEFVVRLPAAPAPAMVRQAANGAPRAPGRSRVLVVEDNRDAAESMQMLLELLGHEVRVAYEGMAAIEVAQAERPDLMLVDIGLPGIDGYELARRVRRQPALAEVRMVAITGYGREEDRRRALAAGFDDHLVKPVDLDVLKALLARAPGRPGGDARTPD